MKKDVRKSILVASDQQTCAKIQECIRNRYRIYKAYTRDECFYKYKQKRHEFALIDIALFNEGDDGSGVKTDYQAILSSFWQIYPTTEIIIITQQETIREAVYAVKAGAGDYLTRPISCEEVTCVTERIQENIRTQLELDYLRDQFWDKEFSDFVKTKNPLMKSVFDKVRSVAPTHTTVMLYGETGTGKGVVGRLIHAHSNRKENQFISVHCGALPDTLIESELFGHEKGAFTGADKRKRGKFEVAQEGTLFLDEISTISPSAQIKLLQVLQDRIFRPIGSEDTVEAKARFVAASNVNLKELAEAGTFRKDLYYRLNVFPIELPPLRLRTEDIPILTDNFLKRLNSLYNKEIRGLHPIVTEAFESYSWPGNIRELENIIERAHILETSPLISPESIPGELFTKTPSISQVRVSTASTLAEARHLGIENIERQYLKDLLMKNKGKINKSAEFAGISTRQLHKLLTRYKIKKENYKT